MIPDIATGAAPSPAPLTDVDPVDHPADEPARSTTRRATSIGFWPIVELAGLVMAGSVIVLLLLGYQLVILTTSSMAPSAPAGSMLIVSSTPSELVEIDDIIVMDRGGALPVTHRVIELQPATASSSSSSSSQSADSETVQILAVTKGDANQTADPRPFPMSGDQRVVQAAIPRVGWFLLILVNHTPEFLVLAAVMSLALVANCIPDRSVLDLVARKADDIRERNS